MKVIFKNRNIKTVADLGLQLKAHLEESMDESVAYMADQTQKNSPVTKNDVDLGDSVKVEKTKIGSIINYKIKVEHSSALRYHEDPDIKKELVHRSGEEKVLGSETGGVGSKFVQRAVYNSKNKVLDYMTRTTINKLKNKDNESKLTTKTLDDFK